MSNFYYPLTPKKLKKRYRPLFKIIKRRQSGSYIGLPVCGKSGYLQFLLREKKIIKSLLPDFERKTKILYFEPVPFKTENQHHWLFQLSLKLEMMDSTYSHCQTEDPAIIMTNIQKYLIGLAKEGKHLTIILSNDNSEKQ